MELRRVEWFPVVGYVTGGSRHETVALLLDARSPRYRTSSGLGVGSSYAKLISAGGVNCYGGTECQHGYKAANKPGTTFKLDARGARSSRSR